MENHVLFSESQSTSGLLEVPVGECTVKFVLNQNTVLLYNFVIMANIPNNQQDQLIKDICEATTTGYQRGLTFVYPIDSKRIEYFGYQKNSSLVWFVIS